MNTQRKTTGDGRTGFWMRAGSNLSVRVVNGTMYKLLNAKKGYTLTRILSQHLGHQILRARLYGNGRWTIMESINGLRGVYCGLHGLKASLYVPGWVSNTKSLRSRMQRRHLVTSRNTYSNPPFSRLTGLKDGSASDTLKAFQMRRNERPTR